MNFKKAITPVVGTALLLIVAVISVIGFQGWFENFSSSMFTDIEQNSQSTIKNAISIEQVVGNTIYIKNSLKNNYTLNYLKIGNENCIVSKNLTPGLNKFDISLCITNLTSKSNEVVILTNNGIQEKYLLFDSINTQNSQSPSIPTGPPLITFTSSSYNIPYNTAITLTWSTTDATTCSASGDWSGSKNTSDTLLQSNLQLNKTYIISCSGAGGTSIDSINITVASFIDQTAAWITNYSATNSLD